MLGRAFFSDLGLCDENLSGKLAVNTPIASGEATSAEDWTKIDVLASIKPSRSKDEIAEAVSQSFLGLRSVECIYELRHPGSNSSRHKYFNNRGRCRSENVHFGVLKPEHDANRNIQIFDGSLLTVTNLAWSIIEVNRHDPKKNYSWKVRSNFYLSSTGWSIEGQEAPPKSFKENPFRPIAELLAAPDCELETLTGPTGMPRHIRLTTKNERVLFRATPFGYIILSRVILNPIMWRLECSEHREVSANGRTFVFPMHMSFGENVETTVSGEKMSGNAMRGYEPMSVEKGGGSMPLGNSVIVHEIKVNSDPEIGPPILALPGCLIQDRDTGEWYATPGGVEVLDLNIDIANAVKDLFHQAHSE